MHWLCRKKRSKALFCLSLIFSSWTTAATHRDLMIHQQLFSLEVPETADEYQTGLMYRNALPEHAGMLFLFDKKQANSVSMWMEHTFIALDMLFLDAKGKVVCIIENATPLSRKFLRCDRPVGAVIELNAGVVRQFGIWKGSQIL